MNVNFVFHAITLYGFIIDLTEYTVISSLLFFCKNQYDIFSFQTYQLVNLEQLDTVKLIIEFDHFKDDISDPCRIFEIEINNEAIGMIIHNFY